MFDDGRADNYSMAFPMLQAANVKATVYMITNNLDTAGFLTTAQAQEMYAAGIDIASHTHTHQHLPTLTEAQQETELSAAKAILDGAGMTRASAHVAYPYCQSDTNTKTAMAATGMLTGRSGADAVIKQFMSLTNVHDGFGLYNLRVSVYPPDLNPDLASVLDRLDYIKAHKEIGALMFHSVGGNPGDAYNVSVEYFQAVLDKINALGLTSMTISEWYTAYMAKYGA